ncbi:cortical protein marker for cell polarity-domain-containing protein [Thelonectria olida]|uniref:Cortical protein marker for cell polarity-domain-containing protein n=1 Tax=Thelonectria olida TaxID=1576542 RepID=A0A9P8WG59_9HYPO|nr:cortical protein marker for cell polarity-domain-containing protein [Thelonectria olida]
MRLPFQRRRSTARQAQRLTFSLLGLAALAPSLSDAISFTPVESANLDFSKLGRIGVVGDFSGISLYEYEGQTERTRSTNGSESLLSQLPNGALGSLVSSDASIKALCAFELKNGEMQGVVIGGNFTSLNGTQSKAIALFNPNTTEITPLDGIEGEVNAVLCDQERDTVYVGGNFKGANSTNAIAWVGNEGWTNLPFAGFNGPVNAITKASNGHIIFGGTFTGLGNTSTPSTPNAQIINLSKANITAQSSSSKSGSSDPENIICSNGANSWLLKDDTAGYWDADFGFGFKPTKLRLWNTQQEDRGTKTFRFTAFPINGIMNLTYTDPDTGKNKTCTSECPLQDTAEYQDFYFVNRVGMNRFRISISDWYGNGGGLAGIELYHDDIFAYAIEDFNEPTCGSIENPSSATATGPWSVSPSFESDSEYLTAELTGDYSSKSASVVFYPNIIESGNYSVNMYTPGCIQDGSCLTRGRVNITGVMATSTDQDSNFTTTLYQTNNYDKYDQIYFGYIDQSSDSFKPAITLTPLAGQDLSTLTIVAQKVGFTLIDSTGGLNGLFDFNPSDAVVDTSSLQNSTINKLGASFDKASGVTALITDGDTTYVGGNFTSKDHDNILAIIKEEDVKTLDGGLNGQVVSMYLNGTKLFVGGDFSNTQNDSVTGMNNVAVYDTGEESWDALGAGVDGTVEYVVPLRVNITDDVPEIVIAFSGSFSECKAFDDNDAISVDGFAIWVPSKNNWLQGLDGALPGYSGVLTAAILDLPYDGGSLFAGSISSSQLGANSAATLSDEGFGQFPLKIKSQSTSSNSSSLSKRDTLSIDDTAGVVTGLFYDENDHNITVLAGHFTTTSSDGEEVNNIALIEGEKVTGLSSNISSDSTFLTLAMRGSTLFAGGKISGTIAGSSVSGLLSYNVESKSFNSQLPPLSGGNSTVSAIAVRPDSADVYVGGSFDTAGALDCPGLCTYDLDLDQWNRPGSKIRGSVSSLMWASKNDLVVGGNLTANGSDTLFLASWDAKKEVWSNFPGSDEIPGPVTVLAPASSGRDEIWISGISETNGSVFVMKYDGDKWQTAKPSLSSDSIIRGLQVFTVSKEHDKHDILDKKQVLMLTGSIDIPGFGLASAALFNGTAYTPYALTINSDNSPGSISSIFSQKDDFFSSSGSHLRLVFVILIGLAISLGLMFLLVLAGIILDRVRKRREGYAPAPTSMYDRGSGIQRVPPHELFESLGPGRSGAPRV